MANKTSNNNLRPTMVLLNREDLELSRLKGIKMSELCRTLVHSYLSDTSSLNSSREAIIQEIGTMKMQMDEMNIRLKTKEKVLVDLEEQMRIEKEHQAEEKKKIADENRVCAMCGEDMKGRYARPIIDGPLKGKMVCSARLVGNQWRMMECCTKVNINHQGERVLVR
jgi:hypothetical protein